MNKKTLGEMLDDFGFSVKEIAQEERGLTPPL